MGVCGVCGVCVVYGVYGVYGVCGVCGVCEMGVCGVCGVFGAVPSALGRLKCPLDPGAHTQCCSPLGLCHRACDTVTLCLHPSRPCPALGAATGTAPLWAQCGCLPVPEVLQKRGNGWKSSPHSHFNQRNEAAVGVNRPCTKADVLISFAEEVHCDSFCASLLLSF